MKRLHLLLALALFAALCVLSSGPTNARAAEDGVRFGLATGYSGLGDHAFNDMIHTGVVLMKHLEPINCRIMTPRRPGDEQNVLQGLIDKGCNALICAGDYYAQAIENLARKYPHVLFVLIGGQAKSYPSNVAAVTFAENQASYLAGVLAAVMSKTNHLGFLGAENTPTINNFLAGWEAGARQTRKRIKLDTAYMTDAASDVSPFANPELAKQMALKMYKNGCDVIFAVAAGSNIGVFDAARQNGAFAVGVDSNQDHLAPGYVLTSVIKRLDLAVFNVMRNILDNRFQNSVHVMDISSDAVGLSDMYYTRVLIPEETLKTLDSLKQTMINGRLNVPTTKPVYRFSRIPE